MQEYILRLRKQLKAEAQKLDQKYISLLHKQEDDRGRSVHGTETNNSAEASAGIDGITHLSGLPIDDPDAADHNKAMKAASAEDRARAANANEFGSREKRDQSGDKEKDDVSGEQVQAAKHMTKHAECETYIQIY